MTELLIQGSEEWLNSRLGHVTASNMAAVMSKVKVGESATRRNYKMRLVAERLTGEIQETFKSSAMEHGILNEPLARMQYEVKFKNFVSEIGFCKHKDIEWLGCSPDGLVGDDGLIEIKCPNTATHIENLFLQRVPPEYIKQIQCQLWVMERDWCDFVSFDPRLPEKNQLSSVRVNRDDALIDLMRLETQSFLNEVDEIIFKLNNQG